MGRRALLLALLLAGCRGGKTEIDITLLAEDTVTDAMLATVRTLHVEAGDADRYSGDLGLAGHTLARTEKLVYRPRVDTGALALTLTALDELGSLVACSAPAAIPLSPGLGAPVTMTLHPCTGTPDFAMPEDLLGADLTGADLSVPDGPPPDDLQPPDGGILCPTGAIICDDFETNLAKWSADPGVTIDTAQHRTGTHAAKVHVAGPASGSAYEQQFFGLNQAVTYPVYVRAWIYLPAPTAALGGALMFLVSSLASGDLIFGYGSGVWGLGSQNLGPGEAAAQPNSTVSVVAGTWTCVEWMVNAAPPNGTGGAERVSFNGVDDPSLHVDGVQFQTASEVLFGFTGQLNSSQAVDLWYDDIAIAHAPMGCP